MNGVAVAVTGSADSAVAEEVTAADSLMLREPWRSSARRGAVKHKSRRATDCNYARTGTFIAFAVARRRTVSVGASEVSTQTTAPSCQKTSVSLPT